MEINVIVTILLSATCTINGKFYCELDGESEKKISEELKFIKNVLFSSIPVKPLK